MTALLPRVAVAKRIGVNARSIDRYVDDPKYAHLNFPKPTVINGRRFWTEAAIESWVLKCIRAGSKRAGKPRSESSAAA